MTDLFTEQEHQKALDPNIVSLQNDVTILTKSGEKNNHKARQQQGDF